MACILMPQCNFAYKYFRCALPEETIDIEVRVKTMKGIHTFRRDHTTQVIFCKPWSPILHPYTSLVWKMQTYLELEGQNSSLPHESLSSCQTHFATEDPSSQESRWQKKRIKTPVKRQFKVRLVEKPLPINIGPEAVATTATAIKTSMVKPTATAAKLNPIPLIAYNLSRPKVQEILNATIKKSQEREGPFTPNCGNPPMEQQQSKATATATFATPPTRDDTPQPNTFLSSTNLFVARSWPIPPNGNEVPAPSFIKMGKPDEKAPPKQAAIPCPMVLGNPPQNNKIIRRIVWMGTTMPCLCKSTPNLKTEDSKEEDSNGDRQKAKEGRSAEKKLLSPSPQYPPSYDFPDRLSHHYKTEEKEKKD